MTGSKDKKMHAQVSVPMTFEQAQGVLRSFVATRHAPGLSVSDMDLMWEIEQQFLSVGIKVFEDLSE